MNFCRKFRMRLNHGKSKVMHFRRRMRKEDPDAGFSVDGIDFSQPPRSTKAGKPKEGGCRHPYLGFLLDEALSGSAHFDRALSRGTGFNHKVGKVSSSMGEDMGLWYLQSVVGPSVLYDTELVGPGHNTQRLKAVWEGLLSQATLVGGAEKRSTFNSRRDAFARKRGLMSETAEVPWDIQLKGEAGSLLKRLYDQGPSTMAGRMMPAHPPPTSVAGSMLQHAQDIGLNPRTPVGPWAWKRTAREAVQGARSARLADLSQTAQLGHDLPGDAAYMASVTPAGQVGAWAKLVPAFGTRVNFRRFRIGIMEGCANLVGRRVPGCTPSVRQAVGAAAFNCAHCPGVLETAPHVILECPGTQPVWREALAKATASMEGHPMQGTWAAMAPAAQRGHLLGSAAVFPMEVEQRLRGDSTRALVQGLSALNEDLFKGHAGLSEALADEVKSRSDAKKALARAARTQTHGVQGVVPAGQCPHGGESPPPTAVADGI